VSTTRRRHLVQSFAAVLAPYQGAFVGDTTGLHGFPDEPDGEELDRARSVFMVIDSDPNAGDHFRNAADDRIKGYLREYAQAAVGDRRQNSAALARAGTLAGVIAGAPQASGDEEVGAQSAQYWINWLNYELAVALGARPGDAYFTEDFFTYNGALKSPDDVTPSQLHPFSGALQNFAQQNGRSDTGHDLRDLYEHAASK
jgi:hypothetical protein